MKIDQYYICHYTKLSDRKSYIESHISKFNINLNWIYEFDKEDIDFQSITNQYPIINTPNLFNRVLKQSEISLILKHIKIFQDVIDKGYKNVVVFEDDIILDDDFLSKLEDYTNQLPNTYDILWIGSCCDLHITNLISGTNIYRSNSSRCTHGYLISVEGCKKMLSIIHKINLPIDWFFNYAITNLKLENYWAEPDIVRQNSNFESAIQL